MVDARVLNPGWKTRSSSCTRGPALQLHCGRQSAANRRRAQRLGIDAAAVVADGNEDAIALLLGRDQELAGCRLDLANPLGGRSMP